MIVGEFTTNLGAKNRIAIPKKIRNELEGSLFLTRGDKNNVLLLDELRWKGLEKQVVSYDFFEEKRRDLSRVYFGGAVEIETDSQGRFVVPEFLLQHGQFKKEVVFIGVRDWVELWSKENWNTYYRELKNRMYD